MTIKELQELAIYAAKGQAPTNFSVENVDDALRDGLRELVGSVNDFMRNRYDIYDIIIQAADEVVPKKVIDAVGIFAEVQNVPQGQKAMFRTRLGRTRARKFLTQVGLSGVYESFRLDHGYFELSGHAIGGACRLDFERMLDGAESMADYVALLTEAQTDAVYQEVQKALRAAVTKTGVPANNRVIGSGFDGQEMMKLISTVRAYGSGAVIFAPPEFVAAMGADAIVPIPANGNYGGVYHPQDIDAIHNTGYINPLEVLQLFRFLSHLLMRIMMKLGLIHNSLMFFLQAEKELLKAYLRATLRFTISLIETSQWKFILIERLVLRFLHTIIGLFTRMRTLSLHTQKHLSIFNEPTGRG